MFLDTSFNSTATVLLNIYQNFVEAAMKYYRYAKCMAGVKHPHLDLLKRKSIRVLIKKVEVPAGRKLTGDFDGICRYNTRSG